MESLYVRGTRYLSGIKQAAPVIQRFVPIAFIAYLSGCMKRVMTASGRARTGAGKGLVILGDTSAGHFNRSVPDAQILFLD